MLYKLNMTDEQFDGIEPIAYKDFASFGRLEKDLEHLIAQNILGVLFEDVGLMPIHQERQGQSMADIYALNEAGDLTIFELKRSTAGEGAVHQALLYAQNAGQWSHAELQKMYQNYWKDSVKLGEAHKEVFDLDQPLGVEDFNRRQHIVVIGSAAEDSLISAVNYWKSQGISIDFLPYRIYELANEKYFEFFALPYDKHRNPADKKGVLFDTNRTYIEDSIWYMMERNRVAAFGDAKRWVEHINVGDIVFFSHRWSGIVAAAKVRPGQVRADDEEDALYRDVEFITPFPHRETDLKAMPFKRIREITGKSFYWARTIKVPYLSISESNVLVDELRMFLQGDSVRVSP